jgi:hypothetical protein
MEIGCGEFNWTELAQNHAHWMVLVLAVLNLRVLLPVSLVILINIESMQRKSDVYVI